MLYEPREDSFLMCRNVAVYSKGRVLDMGCGSGIQTIEASKHSESVVGSDIDADAIEFCRKKYSQNSVEFIHSDLFENIQGKFDLIIFNAPYLPSDPRVPDVALDGGKKGYEIIARFLQDAKEHLQKDGIILLLFSSLTNKKQVDVLLKSDYDHELIDSQKLDFEELYVYKIKAK